MAPGKARKSQAEAAEKFAPASAPKRIKTETIPGNADPATRAASALDLASDSVPENLRCPICTEIPLGEVLQCPNGHPICKSCQEKIGKVICSQCQEAMKTGGGRWIRNRFMEQYLDSHWFLCPFKKSGCQEVLSREQVESHKKDCVYDGKHIQICKYLDSTGENCQFWTHILKPIQSLVHLQGHFTCLSGIAEGRDMHLWFPVNRRIHSDYVEAAVVQLKNGTTLLIIGWSMRETEQLSFVCLRMSERPRPGPVRPKLVKLTFENQKRQENEVPNLSLTLPIVSVLDAKLVLEEKLVSASRRFLEENYLDHKFEKSHANCLKVAIDLVGEN